MSRIGKFVAPFVVSLAMAAGAKAQVPQGQGLFGNVDGRWTWLGGDPIGTPIGTVGRTSSGPGGQLLIGYKLTADWDVAVAGDIQHLLHDLTKLPNGWLSVDTNHNHFDLEVGFTRDWWRINAGLRGIHYHQGALYNVPSQFVGYDQRDMYGIGPKVGVAAGWAIANDWAIIGGADAALVYTSFNDYGTGALINNGNYWQFVPQLSSELGLSWHPAHTPQFALTVGGRIAASFNTTITADGHHQGTLFEVGPFIRISYNFSGPTRSSAVAAPAKLAPAPSKRQGYQLFFSYDRDDISPVAASLIRQAADDTRRGRPATLQVNDTAYESEEVVERRINAVREQLVKHGVAPEQISVAPCSEGETLTPSAGGLQEAANRRVQITF